MRRYLQLTKDMDIICSKSLEITWYVYVVIKYIWKKMYTTFEQVQRDLWNNVTKSCVYLRLQDVSPRGFSRDHQNDMWKKRILGCNLQNEERNVYQSNRYLQGTVVFEIGDFIEEIQASHKDFMRAWRGNGLNWHTWHVKIAYSVMRVS